MAKGYEGKITNKGSQMVKAPYQQTGGKSPSVMTGGDLRSGKGGKKSK